MIVNAAMWNISLKVVALKGLVFKPPVFKTESSPQRKWSEELDLYHLSKLNFLKVVRELYRSKNRILDRNMRSMREQWGCIWQADDSFVLSSLQSERSLTSCSASNQTNRNFLSANWSFNPSPSAQHECITFIFHSSCSASVYRVVVVATQHPPCSSVTFCSRMDWHHCKSIWRMHLYSHSLHGRRQWPRCAPAHLSSPVTLFQLVMTLHWCRCCMPLHSYLGLFVWNMSVRQPANCWRSICFSQGEFRNTEKSLSESFMQISQRWGDASKLQFHVFFLCEIIFS